MKNSRLPSFVSVALVLALGVAGCATTGSGAASTGTTTSPAATSDIVDTAVANGSFTTLVAAVQAAGLVDTLKSSGPFTVFAPTDAAFAALPPGTVESLLRPENREQLRSILLYHVVAGEVRAATVVGLDHATTVQGADVRIRTEGGRVMLNDATVLTADVGCSNGVIHVIDRVIMPPAN